MVFEVFKINRYQSVRKVERRLDGVRGRFLKALMPHIDIYC